MSFVQTHTGRFVDFIEPKPDDFCIEDVAQGLANECRFSGNTKRFYSVAEHVWHCSWLVPSEFAYEALMHDRVEYLTGDMPAPLKNLCSEFRNIEQRLERASADAFNLPVEMSDPVHRADLQMLFVEKDQALAADRDWGWECEFEVPEVELSFWGPEEARYHFMHRYHEVKP